MNRKLIFSLLLILAIIPLRGYCADPSNLDSSGGFQLISPDQLRSMMQGRKDFVVVDTRSPEGYREEHIKGAVNVPWEFQLKNDGGLPRNKSLVLYCDCSEEETSRDMARQLVENFGYDRGKMLILKGGLWEWQDLKYPMDNPGRR